MHRLTPTIIVLALIAIGCDDSERRHAKNQYLMMLAKTKEIGLDVSREPTENKSTAWYTQRTEALFLDVASTLEGRWRETHCKDEPADCYARIDRRLLQLSDDGVLPPLPDDADEAQRALDEVITTIRDLAPSPGAMEQYLQERIGP